MTKNLLNNIFKICSDFIAFSAKPEVNDIF